MEKEVIEVEKKIRQLGENKNATEKSIAGLSLLERTFTELIEIDAQLQKEHAQQDQVAKELVALGEELAKQKALPSTPETQEALTKKVEEIQNKLNKMKAQEEEIKKSIAHLQAQKQEKKNLIPKGETQEALQKKLSAENATLSKITTQFEEQTNKAQKLQSELENIKQQQTSASTTLTSVEAEIKHFEENAQKLTQCSEQLSKKEEEIAQISSHREKLTTRKHRLEKFNKKQPTVDNLASLIMADFKTGVESPDIANFEAFWVKNSEQTSNLYIIFNDLAKILAPIQPEETVVVSYPISTQKPRNDVDYRFPTVIFYDSDPPRSIQKYEIVGDFLPDLQIAHERRKISLGKIIDSFEEAGKFAVTLLIKNTGNQTLSKFRILDQLPLDAEISNAAYEFEEKPIDAKLKQVLWHIPEIQAFQEKEVNYIVDLHATAYDLNECELRFEE